MIYSSSGKGMQILMNGSQKKMMFSRLRNMLSTKNAQIVMRGILKPQIQPRLSELPPPAPLIRPERLEPCMALIRLPGTWKEQFGFAPFTKADVGSGSGIGA